MSMVSLPSRLTLVQTGLKKPVSVREIIHDSDVADEQLYRTADLLLKESEEIV